jgi:hypothetical protein
MRVEAKVLEKEGIILRVASTNSVRPTPIVSRLFNSSTSSQQLNPRDSRYYVQSGDALFSSYSYCTSKAHQGSAG